eukprot:981864-Prorocentrum_minimum.AAC.1
MQGEDAFLKDDGKCYEGGKRTAKRLEELALPKFKAISELPALAIVENLRVSLAMGGSTPICRTRMRARTIALITS